MEQVIVRTIERRRANRISNESGDSRIFNRWMMRFQLSPGGFFTEWCGSRYASKRRIIICRRLRQKMRTLPSGSVILSRRLWALRISYSRDMESSRTAFSAKNRDSRFSSRVCRSSSSSRHPSSWIK